jgi:O-antigen ligase
MLASPSVVASLPGSALERSVPTGSARGRPRRRSSAWPLVALFLLLPVWWALGVSGVILSALFLPLLASLVLRRRLVTPRGFGLYLLFLLWCAFSATRLTDTRGAVALAYRGSLYLGAGALFVYVLNAPRSALSPARAVRLMAGFFLLVVAGGLLGMVIADVHFVTPAEHLLPQRLLNDQFVTDLVSASTSSGRAFAAYPIFRPKAPFIYANEWGAAYAMALPFAICVIPYLRTKLFRDLTALLLVVSVFPLVFSLNRGAWLSAAAGMLYATFRLARGRNAQLLKVLALGGIVIGVLMFVTPLGEIVRTRIVNGYGDAHREELYAQSIELVRESPLLGYGAPVLVEGNLSAGTHGQLWTIVVSQGLPGLVLFVAWLLWALWKTSRPLPIGHPGDANVRFWAEVAIFTAIVQMPYYDLLPWGLAIAMVAAGLAWREWMAGASARPRSRSRAIGLRA